jgi:hypothetical protein
MDPDNTGSICVFAVNRTSGEAVAVVWVAAFIEEETVIESWLGEEVEPGRFSMKKTIPTSPRKSDELMLPEQWLSGFPSGREIFRQVISLLPRAAWS